MIYETISLILAVVVMGYGFIVWRGLLKSTAGVEKKYIRYGGLGVIVCALGYAIFGSFGILGGIRICNLGGSISILFLLYGVKLFLDNIHFSRDSFN